MADPRVYRFVKEQARYMMSRVYRDRSALSVFMFHAVVQDQREVDYNLIEPAQCTTLAQFRHFVQFHLEVGYRFVGPRDVLSGLEPGGDYVMVTFDDGYFNNLRVLPVLQEFRIPAVFFIATEYVRSGRCFWPDVVHRERIKRGVSPHDISRELRSLKRLGPGNIERYLVAEFGAGATGAVGDLDRPFRPAELAEFAAEPYVDLGNHTRDHAVLTNLTASETVRQIAGAQEDLCRICGIAPKMIAYPNGDYSGAVLQAAADAGIMLGVTVEKRKNYLPLPSRRDDRLTLGRFRLRSDRPLVRQLEITRGDLNWNGLVGWRQKGRAAA
jgi:peptidoglycan/xylan/chitin deacetylase (PgdA/CDA1 family)